MSKKYRVVPINTGGALRTSYGLSGSAEIIFEGTPKQIRYLPYENTIFVGNQKEQEGKGEKIELPKEGFNLDTTNRTQKLLVEYLLAYPTAQHNAPKYNKKPAYIIEEVAEKAKEELQKNINQAELVMKAASLKDADVKRLAFQLAIVDEVQMNREDISILRSRIIKRCMDDGEAVQKIMTADLRPQIDLIIDALEVGVLVKENSKGSVLLDEVGRTFVKNVLGGSAINDAALIIKNDSEKENLLRKKIIAARTGIEYTPDFDGISDEDYLLAEEKIIAELGKLTYSELIDKSFEMHAADKQNSIYKNSGSLFKLKGNDQVLKATSASGETLYGKEAAKKVLIESRSELERQFKVQFAKIL